MQHDDVTAHEPARQDKPGATTGVSVWLQLYVGDFLIETAAMSSDEVGALILLRCYAWRNGGALPADEDRLQRLSRLSSDQWSASRSALLADWTLDPVAHVYRCDKLDAQLAQAVANREQRSAAGKALVERMKRQKQNDPPKRVNLSAHKLASPVERMP